MLMLVVSLFEKGSPLQLVTASGIKGPKIQVAVEALRKLTAPIPPRGQQIRGDAKLERVYVRGITGGPLKRVRQHLQDLRFRTSKIANISFCGPSILEFLIEADGANVPF